MTLNKHLPRFTAIILAGDRSKTDPLLENTGASCKALVKIGGRPMLQRVISALNESNHIENILLSGPSEEQMDEYPALQALLSENHITQLPAQNSPSASAYAAMQSIDSNQPVLVTTADHPLLHAEMIDYLLEKSLQTNCDMVAGMTTYALIRAAFPNATKTVMRFTDGEYCGCNLFAFLTPGSRKIADAWRQVEQKRKNPLRVISQIGWWSVLQYFLKRLSMPEAVHRLSTRLGVRIGTVYLPFPEAAIDVDSIADRKLVEEITRKK